MTSHPPLRLRVGAGHNDHEAQFPLPPQWDVAVASARAARPRTPDQIRRRFAEPVHSAPIRAAARGARNAVVLVDDFRRPTPAETLCLEVVRELNAAGITRDNIAVILGGSAHRTMTRHEVRRRLGTVLEHVGRVVAHDAFSRDVAFLGVTAAGTPVLVNRIAAEADFSVSVSTVYPHALTGWGGGAKMVLPGIAHVSTSTYHHTRLPAGEWACAPHRSPARRDLEEAAALFGLDVSVCAVMNMDKTLAGLFVGAPTQAHRRAVRRARRVYDTPLVQTPPDLVIANAYPFDGDPTQLSKALIPARRCGAPAVLVIADFTDPCDWHGVYHGPRDAYMKRAANAVPERTAERLEAAQVFLFSPRVGKGYVPADRTWYCDSDWDRLMAALQQRFGCARVTVLPAAPLQMPRPSASV